jgi:hypothetical protein
MIPKEQIIQFMFQRLSSTPDLYLDELRLELEQRYGVTVNSSTVWRALRRSGYTMKMVSLTVIFLLLLTAKITSCLVRQLSDQR